MALYKLVAYMNYDVRPSDYWTASIEKELGEDDISSGAIEIEADNFVAGLKVPLLANAIIDRVVVSTWEPDSSPYDPDAVRVISYNVVGDRGYIVSEPVDDSIVYFCRKNSYSGRSGKFQLRGVLLVSDLTAASGSWALDNAVESDFADNIAEMFSQMSNETAVSMIGLSLLSVTYPAVAAGVKQVPIKLYSDTPIVRLVIDCVGVKPTERQERQ